MTDTHSAETAWGLCWRSECRSGCYYPRACSERIECVGCETTVPMANDPADTPEPHRSRCLGLPTSPGKGSDG